MTGAVVLLVVVVVSLTVRDVARAWIDERRSQRATDAELAALRAAIAAERTAREDACAALLERVRDAERAAGTRPRLRA